MIVLRVNGRDLAPYARPWAEDGFSMDPEAIGEPQFAGNAAFSEGLTFTQESNGNRHWEIPLILDADNRAAFHSLIRDINTDLVQGADVEFATDSTDDISHFTLQAGRLDPIYSFMHSVHSTARATLHLWTLPFSSTGTARSIGTVSGTGLLKIRATGVLGDQDTLGVLTSQLPVTPSPITAPNPFIFYGVKHPVPSGFNPLFLFNSGASPFGISASVFGASGRLASQYYGGAVDPDDTGFPQTVARWRMRPQDAGRYRLIAQVRSRLSGGSYNRVFLKQSDARDLVIATGPFVGVPTAWGIIDLGEITVPASGMASVARELAVMFLGATGASAVATYPVQLDHVVAMPIDQNVGMVGRDLRFTNMIAITSPTHGATVSFRMDARAKAVNDIVGGIDRGPVNPVMFKGDFPRIPPVGSPGASGPAELYVYSAMTPYPQSPLPDVHGGDTYTADLRVTERWKFLR